MHKTNHETNNKGSGNIQNGTHGYHLLPEQKMMVKFAPKTYPYDSKEKVLELKRQAQIGQAVKKALDTLAREWQTSPIESYRNAWGQTDWNRIAEGLIVSLAANGLWWHDWELQEKLIYLGWITLKGAQFSEIGFALAGIVLSVYGAQSFTDPLFWIGFIPSTLGFPLCLNMNWNGVNATSVADNDFRSDIICPDEFAFDTAVYEKKGEIQFKVLHDWKGTNDKGVPVEFKNALIKQEKLGFKGEDDSKFYLDFLVPLTAAEPDNHYTKTNYVFSWFHAYGNFMNNLFAPPGNWIAIAFGINAAVNALNGGPEWLVSLGAITLAPIELFGASYFISMNYGLIKKADLTFISSRNPLVQSFRIAPLAAVVCFLEYLNSISSRTVAILSSLIVSYRYLGLDQLMQDASFNQLTFWSNILVGTGVFWFSLVTRNARAFLPITKPMTFATPFINEQTITDKEILNAFGALAEAKGRFSSQDRNSLIMYSIFMASCWLAFPVILAVHFAKKWTTNTIEVSALAGIPTMPVFAVFIYLYYKAGEEILNNRRANNIIGIRCGHPLTKLSPQVIRLARSSVLADTVISRILSVSGPIVALSFIADIGLDPYSLFFGITALAVPAGKVSYAYFLPPITKQCKGQIDEIAKLAEEKTEGKGCGHRMKIGVAKICTSRPLSYFFKVEQPTKEAAKETTKESKDYQALSIMPAARSEQDKTKQAADAVLEHEEYESSVWGCRIC